MSPPTKLTSRFLSVWHVWVVRTAQHAPGLCPHYIKQNHLTLAGPHPLHYIYSSFLRHRPRPPLSVFLPCRGRGGNNPITLQEAQRWSNGENIKTVLHRVTYMMDPGIEMKRGDREKNQCWREGGRDTKPWGERCRWYDVVGVAAQSSWSYPCTLEQAVIETTLINFCTLSRLLSPSITHKHTTKRRW